MLPSMRQAGLCRRVVMATAVVQEAAARARAMERERLLERATEKEAVQKSTARELGRS